MKRRRLKDVIKEPCPSGWTPKRGDWVVIPSLKDGRERGWSAVVDRVTADIVTVRVLAFRMARQQWLVADLRPHPRPPNFNDE